MGEGAGKRGGEGRGGVGGGRGGGGGRVDLKITLGSAEVQVDGDLNSSIQLSQTLLKGSQFTCLTDLLSLICTYVVVYQFGQRIHNISFYFVEIARSSIAL